MQRLLAPREAAHILGISYPTLMKQWIYRGKLKTAKTPGGHHRVPESEIDPPHSRIPQPRRTLFSPRQFPQDQWAQPAHRPRHRHQIQRPARANHPGHRRAAHHFHHHRRRRQGNAPQARRTRRRPGQIHRSHDPPRLTPMLEVKFNPTRVCRARLLFTLTKEGRRAVCTPNGLKARAPLLVLFCSFFFSTSVHAQTLRIAAAADLQFVLPDLASQYEKQNRRKSRHHLWLQRQLLRANPKRRALRSLPLRRSRLSQKINPGRIGRIRFSTNLRRRSSRSLASSPTLLWIPTAV